MTRDETHADREHHATTPREWRRRLHYEWSLKRVCRTAEQEAVEREWISTFLRPVP